MTQDTDSDAVVEFFDTECRLDLMKDGSFRIAVIFTGFRSQEGALAHSSRVKTTLLEAGILNEAKEVGETLQ